MSFLGNAIETFDRAVGIEGRPCEPDDPQALALVNAGLDLIAPDTPKTLDTKLSEIAEPPVLLTGLRNLNGVYLRQGDFSVGADIIADVTVGELITHLDATSVNTLLDTMREEERREKSKRPHADLSLLEDQIRT